MAQTTYSMRPKPDDASTHDAHEKTRSETSSHHDAEEQRQGGDALRRLGTDILLIILDLALEDGRQTLHSMSRVSSFYRHIARYILHRDITIDLAHETKRLRDRFDAMERDGLAPAVRTIAVQATDTFDFRSAPAPSIEPAPSIDYFAEELLPKLSGLRDIRWFPKLPNHASLFKQLAHMPHVRLHVHSQDHNYEALLRLAGSRNLFSFELYNAPAVNSVLLTCPNLRRLSLKLGHHSLPECWSAKDFQSTETERPPLLEELNVNYEPSHYWITPANGNGFSTDFQPEKYQWAKSWYWSGLKRLQTKDLSFAKAVAPELISIEQLYLDAEPDREEVRAILELIPIGLKAMLVPFVDYEDIPLLAKHGATLTSLQVHRVRKKWAERDAMMDTHTLAGIRDACPLLEELGVDLRPYESHEVLASFPRLRTLTIWMNLELYVHSGVRFNKQPPTWLFFMGDRVRDMVASLLDDRPDGLSPIRQVDLICESRWWNRPARSWWPTEKMTRYYSKTTVGGGVSKTELTIGSPQIIGLPSTMLRGYSQKPNFEDLRFSILSTGR